MTKQELNNALRNAALQEIVSALAPSHDDVLQVESGKVAFPCVDAEGNEKWAVIAVAIPNGSRDGEPFDGYAKAKEYAAHVKEQADKKKAREEASKRKQEEALRKKIEREAKKAAEKEEEGE